MSQMEVLKLLREHPNKWWSSKEISKELNASVGSITCNLARLRKCDMVKYKNDGYCLTWYLYKYKPIVKS